MAWTRAVPADWGRAKGINPFRFYVADVSNWVAVRLGRILTLPRVIKRKPKRWFVTRGKLVRQNVYERMEALWWLSIAAAHRAALRVLGKVAPSRFRAAKIVWTLKLN